MGNNRHQAAGIKVYLDDERPTPSGWVRAYWPQEVIGLLKQGNVAEVSLDHDLGNDRRGTGNDVVLWVEEQVVTAGFKPPAMRVHSANSSARIKMESGIRQIQKLHQRFAKQAGVKTPSALYHVTFLHRIPSIRSKGLRKDTGNTFGGYGGHSQGRVFFADWGGVKFWMSRYEDMAENQTDTPEDGWVPVVLRIKTKHLDMAEDDLGSRDSMSGAFYIEQSIPSNRIAMWDGDSWVGLRSINVDDMIEEAKDAAEFETEDEEGEQGEPEGWYIMDYGVFAPSRKASNKTAGVSTNALKLIEVMAKGSGKTSTININILNEALNELGWSAEESPSTTKLTSDAIQELFKPVQKKHMVEWIRGGLSFNDPTVFVMSSEREAHALLKDFTHYARKSDGGKKGPTHPEAGTLYYNGGSVEFLERMRGGMWAVSIEHVFLGVTGFRFTPAVGSSIEMGVKVDRKGRPDDVTKAKVSRFWTWAYKNGLQQAATEYRNSGGADALDNVRKEKELSVRSLDNTGTCPACFRNVKMITSRKKIQRHGWNVVNNSGWKGMGGWHRGGCPGTGWPPFELSSKGALHYKELVEADEVYLTDQIEGLKAGTVPVKTRRGVIDPSSPRYAQILRLNIRSSEHQLQATIEMIREVEARIQSWTQKPLPGQRTATKSEGEKDDEKAGEMLKPAPKKKPPRQDLRRHRVRVDDPDLEGQGADDDRDLSMNYKRVARRFLSNLIEKTADDHLARLVLGSGKVPADKDPKKPGDFWQNESGGWSAQDPKGQTTGFQGDTAEAQAEAWASGKGKGPKEDSDSEEEKARKEEEKARKEEDKARKEEEKAKKRQKEEQKKKTQQTIEKTLNDVLSESRMDKTLSDNLSAILDVQDEEFHEELAKAFEQGLKTNRDKLMSSDKVPESLVNSASEALDIGTLMQTVTNPAKIGQVMADYIVAKRIMANPSMVGGKALGKVGEEGLSDRAWEAFGQYMGMTNALRTEAMDQIETQLLNVKNNADEGESDPKYKELKNIETGLVIAAMVHDQDPVTSKGKALRSKVSPGFKQLIRSAHATGALEALVRNGGTPFGPSGRAAMRKTLDFMADDELVEAVAGKNSEYSELGDLLNSDKLPAAHQAFFRDLIKDMTITDMDRTQAMLNSFSKANKGTDTKDSPEIIADELMEQARQQAAENEKRNKSMQELFKCLEESEDPNDCEGVAKDFKLADVEAKHEAAKNVFDKEPPVDDPDTAQVRDALDSQNPKVLQETWVKQGEKPEPSFVAEKPDDSVEKKRQKWLQHITDPKEKERIQQMSPDEFMVMMRSVMKEEEEEEVESQDTA